MHSQILLVCAVGLLLLAHVRFVLIVDKVNNGGPANDQRCRGMNSPVSVVDVVAESRSVNDAQLS